jgi:hypothetical protein
MFFMHYIEERNVELTDLLFIGLQVSTRDSILVPTEHYQHIGGMVSLQQRNKYLLFHFTVRFAAIKVESVLNDHEGSTSSSCASGRGGFLCISA